MYPGVPDCAIDGNELVWVVATLVGVPLGPAPSGLLGGVGPNVALSHSTWSEVNGVVITYSLLEACLLLSHPRMENSTKVVFGTAGGEKLHPL